ncbi:unnamed protein product [Leptosia nina]|uniref:Secreted protein n=1 Tax=Leptosia nina TaxID=320188 RepID=A0AAV1JAQ5_9NEOP
MRLVGCLLLPTDIRACLYEPGMGEGSVQPRVQSRAGPRQTHHSGQPRSLVMRETGHIVHRHRLVWQHRHRVNLNYSLFKSAHILKFQKSNPFSTVHRPSSLQIRRDRPCTVRFSRTERAADYRKQLHATPSRDLGRATEAEHAPNETLLPSS